MSVTPAAFPDFWRALLRAEAILTVNIVSGLAAGELILGLGLIERLFKPLLPRVSRLGISEHITAAIMMAVGSPRSGAALIAAAYSDGEVSREEATYGVLSLAFPGYLRRWVGTAAVAYGIAGIAGTLFALVLILRSACRFAWVLALLPHSGGNACPLSRERISPDISWRDRAGRAFRMLARSLPWAWLFFAFTYAMVPYIESFFAGHIAGWRLLLPASGWAVAASSVAHVTAALSSAAGAMAAGDLGIGQAVLALLVVNMIGTVTRTIRQNVGYWTGIFPGELLPSLLKWHLVTTITLELTSVAIVWCVAGVMSLG